MTALVTAIIPTLAEAKRQEGIHRAVASLRQAVTRPESLEILAVVNGQRHDADVIAWLEREQVHVIRVAEASAPHAQRVGRQHVRTPYFCFLDDDDEYLAGAIDARLGAMSASPPPDIVVTNGWRHRDSQDETAFHELDGVERDPLLALFRENWLASCGALFGTERVGTEYFEDFHPFLEWTWLAYRLVSDGRSVRVLDQPTFRIHDTPGSASKSARYAGAELSLYERMLECVRREDVRRLLLRRIQNQWSMQVAERIAVGDRRGAWTAWSRVMQYPEAWRYGKQLVRLAIGSVVTRETRRDESR